MRAELLERYRSLPLPSRTEEHWRFTDLAGFDPDAWASTAAPDAPTRTASLLDLDVAGSATVDETGIRTESVGIEPNRRVVIVSTAPGARGPVPLRQPGPPMGGGFRPRPGPAGGGAYGPRRSFGPRPGGFRPRPGGPGDRPR